MTITADHTTYDGLFVLPTIVDKVIHARSAMAAWAATTDTDGTIIVDAGELDELVRVLGVASEQLFADGAIESPDDVTCPTLVSSPPLSADVNLEMAKRHVLAALERGPKTMPELHADLADDEIDYLPLIMTLLQVSGRVHPAFRDDTGRLRWRIA